MTPRPAGDPVLIYTLAGLTIDVYPNTPDQIFGAHDLYIARIRDTDWTEVGPSAMQAVERVFWDYCDMHVAALVLKDGAK